MELKILKGDNLELLKQYPDNYFDSVCTDCPYGLGKEPDTLKLLQDWIDSGYHEIIGKGFMGKSWDAFVPQPLFWKEVFRVLKPGGYVLAFFGTRTYDWGTLAIRLAGFEIRDMITWMYGSGFPKSLNISKQIDKRAEEDNIAKSNKISCGKWLRGKRLELKLSTKDISKHFPSVTGGLTGCVSNWEAGKIPTWEHFSKLKELLFLSDEYDYLIEDRPSNFIEAERKIIGEKKQRGTKTAYIKFNTCQAETEKITVPSTQQAKKYSGFGTALKPASEPICVARKPIEKELTVAENVLKYGTGGINIGECLIEFESDEDYKSATYGTGTNIIGGNYVGSKLTDGRKNIEANPKGRFPANVILDPFMSAELDNQTGVLKSGAIKSTNNVKTDNNGNKSNSVYGKYKAQTPANIDSSEGGASRFFYCAKASQYERHLGCESLDLNDPASVTDFRPSLKDNPENWTNGTETPFTRTTQRTNIHPTVKPISLIRYLQRLVTPKGGITLDPFAGSGTAGCSAYFEDISECVLMELDFDGTYIPIIEARTKYFSIEKNRLNYLEDIKAIKEETVENQLKMF